MVKKSLKQLFEAMYHGNYDFDDFLSCNVRDDFDVFVVDERDICRPNKKLKKYHTFLNLFWFERFQTNMSVVYSYRKGVNVYHAVSKHANSKHFFQTDIAKFFQSIDVALIRKTIISNVDLVPVADARLYIDRILDLVTVDGVLPVGFATSPPISNACLFEFDNLLQAYCVNKGLIYTRYADDLIISSNSREDLADLSEKVQEVLIQTCGDKMELHRGKTKVTHVGSKIKLLGMVILPNGSVSVDIKFKSKIEVILHFYSTDREKFLNFVDSDIGGGLERISGYLGYINTVDKNYLNKLRRKYGVTVVDLLLHYSPDK